MTDEDDVRWDKHSDQAIADYVKTFDWWSQVPLKRGTIFYRYISKFGASVRMKVLSCGFYGPHDRETPWRIVGLYLPEEATDNDDTN